MRCVPHALHDSLLLLLALSGYSVHQHSRLLCGHGCIATSLLIAAAHGHLVRMVYVVLYVHEVHGGCMLQDRVFKIIQKLHMLLSGGVTTVLNPTPASAPQRAAAAAAAARAAGAASPSGTAQASSTAPTASAQATASIPAGTCTVLYACYTQNACSVYQHCHAV